MNIFWRADFGSYGATLTVEFKLHEECDREWAEGVAFQWLRNTVKHPDVWQLNDLQRLI